MIGAAANDGGSRQRWARPPTKSAEKSAEKSEHAKDGRGRQRWPRRTPTMGEHANEGEHAKEGRARQGWAWPPKMGGDSDKDDENAGRPWWAAGTARWRMIWWLRRWYG